MNPRLIPAGSSTAPFAVGCAVLAAVSSSASGQAPPGAGLVHRAVIQTPDASGVEIPAIDPALRIVWLTSAGRPQLARLSIAEPDAPSWLPSIDLSAYGSEATSVAVADGLVAVTLLAHDPQQDGTLLLLSTEGDVLDAIPVGPHPDMVTFVPHSTRLLVANEGEPHGSVDPTGSVAVIDIVHDGARAALEVAAQIQIHGDFSYRSRLNTASTPIQRAHAHNIEPEYIACHPDGTAAYVTCQENNAVAVIDLQGDTPTLRSLHDLGHVDHSDPRHAIDVQRDGRVELRPEPVRSLRQPDGIAAIVLDGRVRLITADEGDPVRWAGHAARAESERDFLFGSRGVTLWDDALNPIETNSSLLERHLDADDLGHSALSRACDQRADKRGAEPEGIAAWTSGDKGFGVVTFERAGAIALLAIAPEELRVQQILSIEPPVGENKRPSPEGVASALLPNEGARSTRIVVVADERYGLVSIYSGGS